MRRFLLACCAVASLGAATAAAGQADAPANPDAVRLQLARDVMASVGGAQTYEAQLKAVMSSYSSVMKTVSPNESAAMTALRESMLKYVLDEEVKAIPQMLDDAANIYAKHLTEAELRDLLAWSNSESGRSIRAKMPEITGEMVQSMAPMLKKMRDGILSQAIARACEANHCTSDQRQTLTALVHKATPAT